MIYILKIYVILKWIFIVIELKVQLKFNYLLKMEYTREQK
nr:MAG TPA: hypothetical protein [Crassvirales sp.]